MKQVAQRFLHNKTAPMSVDWYITKRCNFDCSYCVEYLHDNHSKHPPWEKAKLLVDIIEEEHFWNVDWSICGGEPMIIPWILDLYEYIGRSHPNDLAVTTNGSVPASKYIEAYKVGLSSITLSMHFEFIQHRIDEYIDKIIEISEFRKQWNKENPEKQKNFIPRFMIYPGQLDLIEEMHSKLLKADVPRMEFRNIRPQKGDPGEILPGDNLSIMDIKSTNERILAKELKGLKRGVDTDVFKKVAGRNEFYTQEEHDRINGWYDKLTTKQRNNIVRYWEDGSETHDHYNHITHNRENKYKGWTCWAGMKHMKIAPDGRMYVGSCHQGGVIGNIWDLDENFELAKEPLTCQKDAPCFDYLDLRVPKARKGYEHLVEPYV